jgi:hypothetical protein
MSKQVSRKTSARVKPLRPTEIDMLCAQAARAWRQAPRSARKVWFRWCGQAFYVTHTSFRLIVHTPQGTRVAYAYD